MDYNHFSHTHCWDNKDLPCGIPLEKHTQCCLCDIKYMQQKTKTRRKVKNIKKCIITIVIDRDKIIDLSGFDDCVYVCYEIDDLDKIKKSKSLQGKVGKAIVYPLFKKII